MSEPGLPPRLRALPADGVAHGSHRRDAGSVLEICPFLRSADGSWRRAGAVAEHRCWAPVPPAPLATAKQRQLCLTPAYATCVTYTAASRSRLTRGGPDAREDSVDRSLLWPPVRSTPLVLESPVGRFRSLSLASGRSGGQAILVALMVLAFMILVVARASAPSTQVVRPSQAASGLSGASDRPSGASATPSPSPDASPSGMGSSSAEPTGPPVASASASLPAASATKVPSGARRYTVQTGDTLTSIAQRFGTTVRAISEANGITNPRLIRIGQILVIP